VSRTRSAPRPPLSATEEVASVDSPLPPVPLLHGTGRGELEVLGEVGCAVFMSVVMSGGDDGLLASTVACCDEV